MTIKVRCLLLLFVLLLSRVASAAFADLNIMYMSDTFKTSTTTTITRSMYDLGIGTELGKSGQWIWALNYGGGNLNDTAATTTTYSFTDLGIKCGLFWTKQKSWFSSLTYNVSSKAKFNNGSTEVELRGTSIKADIGYTFWPSETVGLAVKIFYYAPTYTESVNSGALTTVSYTRSIIYPSLSLMYSY